VLEPLELRKEKINFSTVFAGHAVGMRPQRVPDR
jgi:hypothetical protein